MNENNSRSSKRERSWSPRPIEKRSRGEGKRRKIGQQAVSRDRKPVSCRVYVSNIAFTSAWSDLKKLFEQAVGNVIFVEYYYNELGLFRGCGVVELKDAETANKAVHVLDRWEFRGRKLRVVEDLEERDKYGRPNREESPPPDIDVPYSKMGGVTNYNTYGLKVEFLESLGIYGPLANRCYVSNLDPCVTFKKIHEVFKLAGNVVDINLKMESEDRNRGFAYVTYQHPVEAVQAISMLNDQSLYDRPLKIRMFPKKSFLLALQNSSLQSTGGRGQTSNVNEHSRFAAAGEQNNIFGDVYSLSSGWNMDGMVTAGKSMTPSLASSLISHAGLNSLSNQKPFGMQTKGTSSTRLSGFLKNSPLLGSSTARLGGLLSHSLFSGICGTIPSSAIDATDETDLTKLGMSGIGYRLLSDAYIAGSNGIGRTTGTSKSSWNALDGTGVGSTIGRPSSTSSGGPISKKVLSYFESSAGVSKTRSSNTILVENLHYSFTCEDVQHRFKEIGDVCYTELKRKGTAIVRFTSECDAQRAIDCMDGMRIGGRYLEVSFY